MHSGREEQAGARALAGEESGRHNVGHRTMTSQRRASNLRLCNEPSATRVGEAWGGSAEDRQTPLPLGGPGGETGRGSDLISQEGKEKGGERRIRALPLLYFILSPS